VTKFHVDEEFRDPDTFSFTGSVGIDAWTTNLILVGVREDKPGQGWLLFQNWWEGKQILEMTLDGGDEEDDYFDKAAA
jgi:hypothetical protein